MNFKAMGKVVRKHRGSRYPCLKCCKSTEQDGTMLRTRSLNTMLTCSECTFAKSCGSRKYFVWDDDEEDEEDVEEI